MTAQAVRGRIALYLLEWLQGTVFRLPRSRLTNRLKAQWLRLLGADVGGGGHFYPGVWIMTGRGLVLGNRVDLAQGVLITTEGGVTIGDNVLVGYRTMILSSNHGIPPRPSRIIDAAHVHAPVRIHRDAWIGAMAVILPGVTIGEGAVVAAASVVTRDVVAWTVVGGNPARPIRERS